MPDSTSIFIESHDMPEPRISGTRRTVLAVEDEPMLLDVICEIFEMLDWDVSGHGSPEAALAFLEDRPNIDLLFTDYRFPGGISGIDLAAQVRAWYPALHVVIASGYSEDELNMDPESGLLFIQKPFRPVALQALVTSLYDEGG